MQITRLLLNHAKLSTLRQKMTIKMRLPLKCHYGLTLHCLLINVIYLRIKQILFLQNILNYGVAQATHDKRKK